MENIIIVSNRLPVTIVEKDQKISITSSTGGLATGLNSIFSGNNNALWIGWPGIFSETKMQGKENALNSLKDKKMAPVLLTKLQIKAFYEGFSNSTLWPLFHYFPRYTVFNEKHWQTYKEVNEIYCNEILKFANESSIIWIHDYHLLLLPQMLRDKLPTAKIGFFNHIPFPSYEIFRILPVRQEIVNGLMGADLIGFHTYDDVKHFLTSANRILGIDNKMGEMRHENRIIYSDAFPMGIDYNNIINTSNSETTQKSFEEYSIQCKGKKVILSIDRLDYSKGIPEKLKAFDYFLEKNPEWKGKVLYMMIVAPSREKVPMYKKLKTEIDELVGQINAKYRTMSWNPIMYFYKAFPFDSLPALYRIADVAFITPLRDGMNLVCKEYVASRKDGTGVLILSEMAGAAKELHEALIINPYDISQTAEVIRDALCMPVQAQKRRMIEMQKILKKYDVNNWIENFLQKLKEISLKQKLMSMKAFTNESHKELLNAFEKAASKIIFLDFDGTLVPLKAKPEDAKPDHFLISILKNISSDLNTKIVIISGRDKETLSNWFNELPELDLVAEHGLWKRKGNEGWVSNSYNSNEWKSKLKPVLEVFVNRTPGTFVEDKSNSLAWHFRKADPDLGEGRSRELIELLQYFTSNFQLNVIEGKKVIEIRNSNINKAAAVKDWIPEKNDFILAASDDLSDEDLFKTMPPHAFTLKLGFSPSYAKFNLLVKNGDPSQKMRKLLQSISAICSQINLHENINN